MENTIGAVPLLPVSVLESESQHRVVFLPDLISHCKAGGRGGNGRDQLGLSESWSEGFQAKLILSHGTCVSYFFCCVSYFSCCEKNTEQE